MMRARWVVGAVLLLSCGEIREVTVGGSSTTDEATPTADASTTTSEGGGSTLDCPEDCDTDASPADDGPASTSAPLPDERQIVCAERAATIVAGDAAGGSAMLVVADELDVADVDVLVRVAHEQPRSVHLRLAREAMPAVDLMHNDEGDGACRVDLAVRFDDDADASAGQYCEQVDDPAVLAPATPLAELAGQDASGPWILTAIVPSSAAADGTLTDFCLSLALQQR